MRADMVKEAEEARVRQWVIRGGRRVKKYTSNGEKRGEGKGNREVGREEEA